jgi:hypothetical protein
LTSSALYILGALLVATVGLVELFVEGEGLRTVLEVLAAVAGFALITVWLRLNRIALDLDRGRRRA